MAAYRLFIFVLALLSGFCPGVAQASLESPPLSISEITGQSQVIVVAQVINFVADDKATPKVAPPVGQGNTDLLITSDDDNAMPSGEYSFVRLKMLKGQGSKTFHLHLGPLARMNYGFSDFQIKAGDYVMLFLAKTSENQLLPVEPKIPLVQLSGSSTPALESDKGDVATNVLELMLHSLNDPVMRQANTALLRDVNSPLMIQGLSLMVNDPNDKVRDNVLYCMAVNQVVSAIPQIVSLQSRLSKQGGGTYCVTALASYTDSKAASFLNPLLFEDDEYIRLNSALALQKAADASSIPYLILALRDPDPQNVVPSRAYLTLHRVIPRISKPAGDFDYTHPLPQKALLPIYNWWNDELMGVHFHRTEQTTERSADQVTGMVKQLNLKMFSPDSTIRLTSINLLTSKANRTSIPFLVLALQDPDNNVAFGAYKTLHRLVPVLGLAKDAASFSVDRASASQPVYDWWRDELLGKHLPV